MKATNLALYSRSRFFIAAACVLLLNINQTTPLVAGPANTSDKLSEAISTYRSGNFDEAILLLEQICQGGMGSDESRRTAYWYLGKCYVAKSQFHKAKNSIALLFEMGPPLFEPDFEKEHPKLLKLYYEIRKDKSKDFPRERPDPGVQTLAIVDFKNHSFIKDSERYDAMEKGFSSVMMHAMLGATQLKVIERDQIQWLIREQNIQNQFEMEGAVRAGKLLGAHVVLMGSFILQDNNKVFLNARLVKIETSEILLHEAEEGKFKDFLKITRKLAKKIAGSIDAKEVYVPRAEVPNSLDAFMAYSEGLSYQDKEMYDEASEKFRQALEFDPDFIRAQAALDRIKFTAYAENKLEKYDKRE